jgi:hypothetical protein
MLSVCLLLLLRTALRAQVVSKCVHRCMSNSIPHSQQKLVLVLEKLPLIGHAECHLNQRINASSVWMLESKPIIIACTCEQLVVRNLGCMISVLGTASWWLLTSRSDTATILVAVQPYSQWEPAITMS